MPLHEFNQSAVIDPCCHLYVGLALGGVAILAVGAAVMRYINNTPIPKDFPQPNKLKAYLRMIKKIKFWSKLGELLGRGHRVVLLRKLFASYFGGGDKTTPQDEVDSQADLIVSETEYDGVPVKLYEWRRGPGAPEMRPGMVYLHGGGWTLGSADEMDPLVRALAERCGMVIASVNYRLAPENLYPVPFEDCVTATKHFLTNAAKLRVDPTRVAIAGDSAGGHLAAAVALKLRDDSFRPRLKIQVLLYPALQALDFNLPSYVQHHDDPYLDTTLLLSFLLWYAFGNVKYMRRLLRNEHLTPEVREKYGKYYAMLKQTGSRDQLKSTDNIADDYKVLTPVGGGNGDASLWEKVGPVLSDPYFSPLLAEDLRRLPQAYIMTCEQDLLRDEAQLYVLRLAASDVSVMHEHHNSPHALFDFLDLDYAKMALDRLVEYLNKNL